MSKMKDARQLVQESVSVIVPAYNEEAAVGSQVCAIQEALNSRGIPYEILVVDDGSEDRTPHEALRTGARVLRHRENLGYGSALKTGIDAATFESIVIIDADGTYPAEEIPELLEELQTTDMAVGARNGSHVHIPWLRRPAKWVLSRLAEYVAGKSIDDLNSGLRAFRRTCVKQYFALLSNRFSFTTTVTLAFLADNYDIVYRPIDYHRRIGKSKITPMHFVDFVMLILRIAILFRPLRVFVPLGLSSCFLGILKVAFDIIALFPKNSTVALSLLYQPVISTSAILLLLVGIQLLLIGMVADAVLRRLAQQRRPPVPSVAVSVMELEPKPAIKVDLVMTARE